MTIADFWFDPACPYTWITSRWLLSAAEVRPIEVRWHVLSLSVLNEDREDDPENDPEGYLWLPVRVCAAVAVEHGQEALGRFYTALGERLHEGDGEWDPDAFATALAEAGLPTDLTQAALTEEYDPAVRASHWEGIAKIGTHVGTPIIVATGADGAESAFFGPVISRIPRGEEAGRLWDGTLLVAGVEGFHELKGSPHAPPDFG
ncbi:disulfide bond formation protein DsbA [Spirillospora sp. NPDC029432]|uniref:mycothiol-dependent nitroreductase Rv2466c family protein n=1 Tax=Spirillospora sp. NPDC029432 TaxID=3154599 RepID=UPI0034515F47